MKALHCLPLLFLTLLPALLPAQSWSTAKYVNSLKALPAVYRKLAEQKGTARILLVTDPALTQTSDVYVPGEDKGANRLFVEAFLLRDRALIICRHNVGRGGHYHAIEVSRKSKSVLQVRTSAVFYTPPANPEAVAKDWAKETGGCY